MMLNIFIAENLARLWNFLSQLVPTFHSFEQFATSLVVVVLSELLDAVPLPSFSIRH